MSDLSGKRVAIIATDYFEEAELVEPRDALRRSGAEVRVYSTSTDPIQAMQGDTEKTRKVDVDGTFDDLDVSAVDVILVPGGTVDADRITSRQPGDLPAFVKAIEDALS
jgi:protease I